MKGARRRLVRGISLLAATALVAAFVAAPAFLVWSTSSPDTGSLADWVTASTTVAALRFPATIRNASRLPIFTTWLQVYVAHPDGVPAGGWQLVADHHVGTVLPEEDHKVDLVGGRAVTTDGPWFGDIESRVFQALAAEFARRGVRGESPPR